MNMNDHSDLQLPINEVTGCVYCRFNADLPYGIILHIIIIMIIKNDIIFLLLYFRR